MWSGFGSGADDAVDAVRLKQDKSLSFRNYCILASSHSFFVPIKISSVGVPFDQSRGYPASISGRSLCPRTFCRYRVG